MQGTDGKKKNFRILRLAQSVQAMNNWYFHKGKGRNTTRKKITVWGRRKLDQRLHEGPIARREFKISSWTFLVTI